MSGVLDLDRQLFEIINNRLSTDLFDRVMPIVTDLHTQPIFWGLVAIALLYAIFRPARKRSLRTPLLDRDVRLLRLKKLANGIVILGLSMGLSDLVAYRGIKVWVERERPEAAGVSTILRTHSHSGYSFPSNHAANNFALARTIQILAPSFAVPAYIFASIVGFSRVYVGVHYPLDVAAGGLIGFLCASLVNWLIAYITRRFSRR
jgi:undecaprenyl-diphosphatase